MYLSMMPFVSIRELVFYRPDIEKLCAFTCLTSETRTVGSRPRAMGQEMGKRATHGALLKSMAYVFPTCFLSKSVGHASEYAVVHCQRCGKWCFGQL